ncbi:hypothetical protein QTP86_022748 [Hemibagrus guttatus]|nr:hypothetical protein QTP86_022748 [Hemibagrus guttatus]
METPDTTPVQGDGGDVDMVDEPIFKVSNKRKKQDILILGGDFNCTDDLVRNHAEPHVASHKRLWEVMEAHKLSDVWRTFNSGTPVFGGHQKLRAY